MEEENLYSQNSKDYQLENNEDFMELLNNMQAEISIEELQDLIDRIANWYQAKYPDCIIQESIKKIPESLENDSSEKLLNLSAYANRATNFKQLVKTLSPNQIDLLECDCGAYTELLAVSIYYRKSKYRSAIETWVSILLPDEKTQGKPASYYVLSDKKISSLVNYGFFCAIYKENFLEELINGIREKLDNKIDRNAIEDLIDKYNDRIELRHQLLQLTALKIFYSSTSQEIGYFRSKLFISEMNITLGLILTPAQIDEIYNSSEQKIYTLK